MILNVWKYSRIKKVNNLIYKILTFRIVAECFELSNLFLNEFVNDFLEVAEFVHFSSPSHFEFGQWLKVLNQDSKSERNFREEIQKCFDKKLSEFHLFFTTVLCCSTFIILILNLIIISLLRGSIKCIQY